MTHFAEIDENGIVKRVIVAEQDFIDSGKVGNPKNWIQTSYNTSQGTHRLGGTPLRKNYAGIGFKYDIELDAFIPPKPFESWVFNEEKCIYVPPKAMPKDGNAYEWSEPLKNWKKINQNASPSLQF